MKDRSYWILGGGAVAAYLVWKHGEDHKEEGNEDFKKGFTAGFFTPAYDHGGRWSSSLARIKIYC